MQLPQEAILEFQELLKEGGIEATPQEATKEAKELITLMALSQGYNILL